MGTYRPRPEDRKPGWPEEWDLNDHCEIHGYEPLPPNRDDYYKICGECHHIFMTVVELVAKDALVRKGLGIPDPEEPQNIYACPECSHDF